MKSGDRIRSSKGASNEKDTNLQLIMARLGDAYDAAGRTDDAVAAYKRAIELKPSFAYYNNLGESTAAEERSKMRRRLIRSGGIGSGAGGAGLAQFRHYHVQRQQVQGSRGATEKSTELDPKNPQSWYLLGTVLVGSMGFKKVGDKDVPDVQPGRSRHISMH